MSTRSHRVIYHSKEAQATNTSFCGKASKLNLNAEVNVDIVG